MRVSKVPCEHAEGREILLWFLWKAAGGGSEGPGVRFSWLPTLSLPLWFVCLFVLISVHLHSPPPAAVWERSRCNGLHRGTRWPVPQLHPPHSPSPTSSDTSPPLTFPIPSVLHKSPPHSPSQPLWLFSSFHPLLHKPTSFYVPQPTFWILTHLLSFITSPALHAQTLLNPCTPSHNPTDSPLPLSSLCFPDPFTCHTPLMPSPPHPPHSSHASCIIPTSYTHLIHISHTTHMYPTPHTQTCSLT